VSVDPERVLENRRLLLTFPQSAGNWTGEVPIRVRAASPVLNECVIAKSLVVQFVRGHPFALSKALCAGGVRGREYP
jgi:hypothetical protein